MRVRLDEERGEVVIKKLYSLYSDKSRNPDGILLPPDFRPSDIKELPQRAIDYIAGMMDTYAIKKYEELFDKKFKDIEI